MAVGEPEPSTPAAEPDAIERHGDRLVLGGDTTGKRVACRCSRCQHVTLIGREALESGAVSCPGCAPPRNNPGPAARSFSPGITEAENRSARKRHRGGGSQ